jgi:hypothetical protein
MTTQLVVLNPSGSDDTSAINTAISLADGGKVIFHPGAYTVNNGTINLPNHAHLFFDDGAKITNSSSNNLFTHTSDGNTDISITGGTFEGNNTDSSTQFALYFSSVTNIRINGCQFNHFPMGMRLDNCQDFSIENCVFTWNGSNSLSRKSIQIWGGKTAKIANNLIDNGYGIGLDVVEDDTHQVSDIDISSNNIRFCTGGGIVCAGGGVNYFIQRLSICDNSVTNNYFGKGTGEAFRGGINVHGLHDGIIARNIVSNNSWNGIEINGDPGSGGGNSRFQNVNVIDNIITDNLQEGIQSGSNWYVNIARNMLRNNGTYGLYINTANSAVPKKINITDNYFYDSGAQYQLYATGGQDLLIENNHFGNIAVHTGTLEPIYLGSGVGTGILFGWNDFSEAYTVPGVEIHCDVAHVEFKQKQIWVSQDIFFNETYPNGYFVEPMLMIATPEYSYIHRVYLVYTVATSGDATARVGIGISGQHDFFATGPVEIGKAINDRTELTLQHNGQLSPTNYKPYIYYDPGTQLTFGEGKVVIEWIPQFPIFRPQ